MEPDGMESAAHRRPVPRDRMWVHVVWEVVLAAAVVVAVLAVRREDSGALSGDRLRELLVLVATAILLGSAFALSLRAAVPNLAVGAVAMAAGVLPAWLRTQHGYDLRVAVLITLGAAVALGLVVALVVTGLRLPAWAVSLGAALGLVAAAQSLAAGHSPLRLEGGPNLLDWAWPLAAGVAGLSVIGGALGLLPRARMTVGRYRPLGDPAAARGGGAAMTAAAALVGSMVLATGAGLLIALRIRTVAPGDGFDLLSLAAAVAFLGGTSAYGRRGGVFGTALAAAFLQLAATWLGLVEAQPWTRPALFGGAIVLGLLVSRMVEAAGTVEPPAPPEPEDEAGPDTELWDPYGTGSYARTGGDPYPTGGFTPASAYRPDAEAFWPGQAPAPEGEADQREPTRELGAYRESGSNAGPFREPGRRSDR